MKAVVFVVADKSITSSVWDEGVGEVFELLGQHEILEMHSAGFEIGSHTTSHPRLTLINLEIAREEIERSRMILEIFLNAPVKSFAYPFGLVNDQVKDLVKKSGYSFACASYTGPPTVAQDLFEIRRIMVQNTSNRLIFWLQLQPTYIYYRWLRWTVRHTLFGFIKKEKTSEYDKNIIRRKGQKKREIKK
jgi:peptidoglycan/xylan/chitin deacetylase (PgdA/CDA1 family)